MSEKLDAAEREPKVGDEVRWFWDTGEEDENDEEPDWEYSTITAVDKFNDNTKLWHVQCGADGEFTVWWDASEGCWTHEEMQCR